ncbi:MAG: hypothetical protein PHR06_07025 [Candidatus Cloacimonetes bacterium]|nr:hypothetical protein [Candidatus Cloacimonadota bacterium]
MIRVFALTLTILLLSLKVSATELVSVEAGIGKVVSDNRFQNFWKDDKNIHLNVLFPYKKVRINCGLQYNCYKAVSDITDFEKYYINAGITKNISIVNSLFLSLNAGIGNNFMIFEDEDDLPFKHESEIGFSLAAGAGFTIQSFFIKAMIDYQHIFNHYPIELTSLRLSIGGIIETKP